MLAGNVAKGFRDMAGWAKELQVASAILRDVEPKAGVVVEHVVKWTLRSDAIELEVFGGWAHLAFGAEFLD